MLFRSGSPGLPAAAAACLRCSLFVMLSRCQAAPHLLVSPLGSCHTRVGTRPYLRAQERGCVEPLHWCTCPLAHVLLSLLPSQQRPRCVGALLLLLLISTCYLRVVLEEPLRLVLPAMQP